MCPLGKTLKGILQDASVIVFFFEMFLLRDVFLQDFFFFKIYFLFSSFFSSRWFYFKIFLFFEVFFLVIGNRAVFASHIFFICFYYCYFMKINRNKKIEHGEPSDVKKLILTQDVFSVSSRRWSNVYIRKFKWPCHATNLARNKCSDFRQNNFYWNGEIDKLINGSRFWHTYAIVCK